MECDTAKVGELLPVYWFQSTHPHGVRQEDLKRQILDVLFQSTHPHGVRQTLCKPFPFCGCFNPRTRMGCDAAGLQMESQNREFQSTHPHGVRRINERAKFIQREFQSTHPHGVRLLGNVTSDIDINVSIHAPAWGATLVRDRNIQTPSVSIHAPAWGATLRFLPFMHKDVFQSTHPHGVRQWRYTHTSETDSFNPRTRMGCDLADLAVRHKGQVSIHAPAWGATHQSTLSFQRVTVSIHAPAWGATPRFFSIYVRSNVSIHAPAWGATDKCNIDVQCTYCFNPRTRMGCDCCCTFSVVVALSFNPRTRMGCDWWLVLKH